MEYSGRYALRCASPSLFMTSFPQGGGGSPYSIFLTCRQLLRGGGRIKIIDHTALPDNAVTVRGGPPFQIRPFSYLD